MTQVHALQEYFDSSRLHTLQENFDSTRAVQE